MSDKQLYLYPVWVRIWHGINALSIIMLIISGVSMQYSSVEHTLIRFDMAVKLHNIFGIITCISYIYFFISNFLTGNINHYKHPIKGMFDRLVNQGVYYVLGYFKNEAKPYPISNKSKFNPLQQLAYAITMYLFLPMVAISGIALMFPEMIVDRFFRWSGIQVTAFVHVLFGIMVFVFLLVHLYVASIGKHPLKNYKSIISGYHEK